MNYFRNYTKLFLEDAFAAATIPIYPMNGRLKNDAWVASENGNQFIGPTLSAYVAAFEEICRRLPSLTWMA